LSYHAVFLVLSETSYVEGMHSTASHHWEISLKTNVKFTITLQ